MVFGVIKKIFGVVLFFLVLLSFLYAALAAGPDDSVPKTDSSLFPPDQYSVGRINAIIREGQKEIAGLKEQFQILNVKILYGVERGKEVQIQYGGDFNLPDDQKVKPGDLVVVSKQQAQNETTYYIADQFRMPALGLLIAIFLGLVILLGRLRGLTSILGLVFSILILIEYVVPKIVQGGNPLTICLIASFAIAIISLYLAHGFNKRTSIALLSTLITLGISALLAIVFVHLSKLFGLGTEEAYSLQIGPLEAIDLRGLLLGGIIIGVLGVLDDVTTGQSAAVEEIQKANPNLSFKELYTAGISVGREHIASLVNTLALVYAGVSLPLFLMFSVNATLPFWVIANGELIAQELVRALVGSITLLFAVPISTVLSAYFFSRN